MKNETINHFYGCLKSGDAGATVPLLHEDVVWRQPGCSPVSGEHRGKAAVVELLARLAGLGIGVELSETYNCDDAILCRILVHHSIGDRCEFQLVTLQGETISAITHFGDTDYLSAMFRAADSYLTEHKLL